MNERRLVFIIKGHTQSKPWNEGVLKKDRIYET